MHSLLDAGVVAGAALLATWQRPSRRVRAAAVSLGLLTSSAMLVHLSGGYIELHFHFFVMIVVIALYQSWLPFLLAIGYVLVEHGVVGVLMPTAVYNHPDAWAHPWKWAAIHAVFVAGASIASLVNWRLNEAARAHTELVLNSVGEGIIGVDPQGTISFVNPAATRMLGWSMEECSGKSLPAILQHVDDTCGTQAPSPLAIPLQDGTEQQVTDAVFCRKDGTQFPVEYVRTPIREYDRCLGAVITFKDITERKKIDRMKNEFISTVSHELRTPLTSIRGSLGLVAGGVAGAIPPQAKTMIDIAHKNSERLVRLINDILDIEKIESGKMVFDLKPQELMPLVEQAIEANHAYAEQFGVTIVLRHAKPGAMVNVDADRLTQVLTNLLSNAAKFSPRNAPVEVAVSRRDGALRVAVTDHGPGIPAEFHDRIFQKFAQADSSDTRQKGGTGLGLSISKAIVERLGGQIGFTTALGGGTTFYVDLPEWRPPANGGGESEDYPQVRIH